MKSHTQDDAICVQIHVEQKGLPSGDATLRRLLLCAGSNASKSEPESDIDSGPLSELMLREDCEQAGFFPFFVPGCWEAVPILRLPLSMARSGKLPELSWSKLASSSSGRYCSGCTNR